MCLIECGLQALSTKLIEAFNQRNIYLCNILIIVTQMNVSSNTEHSIIIQIQALAPERWWSFSCAAEMHHTLCPVRWLPWWTGSTDLSPPPTQPAACTHRDCLREGAMEAGGWEVNYLTVRRTWHWFAIRIFLPGFNHSSLLVDLKTILKEEDTRPS